MSNALTAASRPVTKTSRTGVILLLTGVVLALASLLSLLLGARTTGLADLWQAVSAFDPASAEQIVLRDIRLPKTLGGLLAGAALGTAGAIMQAVTRNPLADPGLLGVNAGAAAGIIFPVFLLGMTDPATIIWPALAGAFATTVLVWSLGATGIGVMGLLIAGMAVTAFLYAFVRGLLLISQSALDIYRHWILGSLEGITPESILVLLPVFLAGFAAAALAARSLNALALGDDLAKSLGTNIRLTRVLSLVAIACLCAAAVALAGPIGFIGLLMPHAARPLSAGDLRVTIVLSALFGAILLLAADTAGRVVLPGVQIEAGLTIALLGGPVMVVLICRGRMDPL